MEKSIEMKKTNSLVKEQVISVSYLRFNDTEIEKFKSLVEDVDYTDEESLS